MSTATEENKTSPLLPDEKFWQRYSPNHELPLAGVSAFFLHALVIGVIGLCWFLYYVQRDSDSSKPPSHDVVQIAGGGDGFGGMGSEPGLPGEPAAQQTEVPAEPMPLVTEAVPEQDANLKDAPQVELNVPELKFTESKTDVDSILANLEKEAVDKAKKVNPPAKKTARIATSGTGNPKGQGGVGGAGGGLGKGNQGLGRGVGGPGGRQKTKAEIYAERWDFDLGRNAKEHVDQLKAIGLVVVFHSPSGLDYFVKDLNRRPVVLRAGSISQFKDAVQWENTKLDSLAGLASELKLSFVPAKVLLLLPKNREEIIAAEEFRFAKATQNNPQNIKRTHFEFRLRNGTYEPEATMQLGNDGRVYKKS